MSEEAVDLVREEKILNGIMKKVRGRRFPFIKKSFYKYGMAAMIAVGMLLSALSVSDTHLDVYKRQACC